MSEDKIVDCFVKLIEISIQDGDFGSPQAVGFDHEEKAHIFSFLAVSPEEAMRFIKKEHRKYPKFIYGLDRFCKPNQGTELSSCVAGLYIQNGTLKPFIVEYERKVIKHINYQNESWNEALKKEFSSV